MLTSGEPVPVEEPGVERVLARQLLAQPGVLQLLPGQRGQEGWQRARQRHRAGGAGQRREDGGVEAGQPQPSRQLRGGRGSSQTSCSRGRRAPRVVESLQLRELVQVGARGAGGGDGAGERHAGGARGHGRGVRGRGGGGARPVHGGPRPRPVPGGGAGGSRRGRPGLPLGRGGGGVLAPAPAHDGVYAEAELGSCAAVEGGAVRGAGRGLAQGGREDGGRGPDGEAGARLLAGEHGGHGRYGHRFMPLVSCVRSPHCCGVRASLAKRQLKSCNDGGGAAGPSSAAAAQISDI